MDKVEVDLEQARLELNRVIDLRNEPGRITEKEFDQAVRFMQEARDQHTQLQRGYCFCKDEITQP